MKPNWKQISKYMAHMHNSLGGSLIDLEGKNATVSGSSIINTSKPNEVLSIVGNELSPKKLRKFMWDHRKSRRLTRDNAVIWSWFDEDQNKTLVGFAAPVSKEALDRGTLNQEELLFRG